MNLIIGKKAILDAIANKNLKKAIISNKDKFFFNKVKTFLPNVGINNNKKFYDSITNNAHHQFAIGYVEIKTINNIDIFLNSIKDKTKSLVLMLDSINDPTNFGSIIRTANVLGVDAIICKKDNQCKITPTVIKISAGATSNVNIINVTNLNDTINKFKKNGFWIYASCLDKTANKLNQTKFYNKSVIIVGNENKGISNLLIKNSDFKIYIESIGTTQSLNASIATAILLYVAKNKII